MDHQNLCNLRKLLCVSGKGISSNLKKQEVKKARDLLHNQNSTHPVHTGWKVAALEILSMATLMQMPKDMDAAEMDRLRAQFDDFAQSREDVELDLAETTFIDSSGIGAIVFLYKRLSVTGKKLKLINVSGQPFKLLKHLKMTDIISSEGGAAA
ncbi:STAS domain-containing protein [Flexibacterium corallicola]|uniref:STAS domain-containing protein n=1 Tax=Flexibacterium corallicola TaxID=3037259 RepID=UPI00286F249D|nr:STAS domain-containing protein [Pseudovibrio sp. M1P-2-3]